MSCASRGAGGDPLAGKRRSLGVPTFAEAAGRVIEQKRAGWRSPKTARLWTRKLEMYAFPCLGNLPAPPGSGHPLGATRHVRGVHRTGADGLKHQT